MGSPRHRHRDLSLAGKNLGDHGSTDDEGNEIALSQTGLFKEESDGGDGAFVARHTCFCS
jgi:hypothetical protein